MRACRRCRRAGAGFGRHGRTPPVKAAEEQLAATVGVGAAFALCLLEELVCDSIERLGRRGVLLDLVELRLNGWINAFSK